jgi:putative DNA primase/helicase
MTYAKSAPIYLEQGWDPFPLPKLLKAPPADEPVHATGNYPAVPESIVEGWMRDRPDDNTGLRMPRVGEFEVIGIDVDHYGSKVGGDTLAVKELTYGPLPETWRSTSRDINNPSGIYFFRVPAGMKWQGKVGADIEIIQRTFRYAAAWPSIWWDTKFPDPGQEKTKRQYFWYSPTLDRLKKPPTVMDLPMLPEAWQSALVKGAAVERGEVDADSKVDGVDDAYAWMLKNLPGYDKLPSPEMAEISHPASLAAEAKGGAHEMLVSRSHHAIMLAVEGHHGCLSAIENIRDAFYAEVVDGDDRRRSKGQARGEINRAIVNEVEKLKQDLKDELLIISNTSGFTAEDPEEYSSLDLVMRRAVQKRPERVDPELYLNNDTGNAQMLTEYWGRQLRAVTERPNVWIFWNEDNCRWDEIPQGKVYHSCCIPAVQDRLLLASEDALNAAKRAGDQGDGDTEKDEYAKAKEYKMRATGAGNKNRMDAMLGVAASEPGVSVSASRFDAEKMQLGVENGVLDFRKAPDGKVPSVADLLTQGKPDDYISLNTHVPLVAGAKSALWDSYLDTFLPDPAYRTFVQRVFGYSLLGGNPNRLIIFLQGGTSTGKSTILDAVMKAVGDYAGSVNVGEVFREKQDGGPNPALVNALPKRIITASEVGQHNYLHADVIKRMTGEDHLSSRVLYSNQIVERRPAFTPIIATNSMPTIKDGDAALWRRLLILPFDRQVKHTDAPTARLTDDPKALEAILLWLVEGLLSFLEHGLAPSTWPEQTTNRATEFVAGTSDLQQFLSECVVRSENSAVSEAKLHSIYSAWCVSEGIVDREVMGKRALRKALKANGIETFEAVGRNPVTKKTVRIPKFRGILLAGKHAEDED